MSDGNLIVPGVFKSHSGLNLSYKIECDALTDATIEAIAGVMALKLRPFGSVEGVPSGGLRLAKALEPYAAFWGPLLIVDDVCTTGASLEAHRAGREAIGLVIFNRGTLPTWCRAMFHTEDCHE